MAEVPDSLLKIASSPVLQQFLHDCVDDLTGAKEANFDNYNSDIEWTVEDFDKAKKSVQRICRESVAGDLDLPDLGERLKGEITHCLEIRRDDILQTLVKERLVNNGHNLVENIDWRLKWVLGDSKLSSVREALLQVDLHCLRNADGLEKMSTETVNFEMDLDTVDSLIEQLKTAVTELNNIKEKDKNTSII